MSLERGTWIQNPINSIQNSLFPQPLQQWATLIFKIYSNLMVKKNRFLLIYISLIFNDAEENFCICYSNLLHNLWYMHIFLLLYMSFSPEYVSSSVQSLNRVSLQPHGLQHTRPPCWSKTPGACSNSRPSSWWCQPVILSLFIPISSCFQFSQHQDLFQWVSSSQQVDKVLEFQFQHQAFQ